MTDIVRSYDPHLGLMHSGSSDTEKLCGRIRELEAEVERLRAALEQRAECVYEARSYYPSGAPTVHDVGVMGAWCRTHGWDCPNIAVGQSSDL